MSKSNDNKRHTNEESDSHTAQIHKDDHIVGDQDFTNLIGLLNILSRQLELSIEEGNPDYQTITEFCLSVKAAENTGLSEFNQSKSETIKALQYYDRACQRVTHVSESLKLLADRLKDEEWSDINMDLNEEIRKTDSFYNEIQTNHFADLAKGQKTADSKQRNQYDSSKLPPVDDDFELF